MNTVRSLRHLTAILLGSCIAVLAAWPALAQTAPEIRLRQAPSLDADGSTELVVAVAGLDGAMLDADDFRVLEDGTEISNISVEPVLESTGGPESIATMLVLDASGSMDGEPIERIRAAAAQTARTLIDRGIAVGVVRFSTEPLVLSEPTLDVEPLVSEIETIEAEGWTSLYDAIVTSAAVMGDVEGLRSLVVFADGEDNRSTSTIEDAIAAAEQAEAPLTVVVLQTDRLDLSVLEPLATETGGRLATVAEASQLEQVFADVAEDIANQYVIRYSSDILEPTELPITIIAESSEGELRIDSLAINTREPAQIAPPAPSPSASWDPTFAFLATPTGLWLGIATAFLAVLMLLWMVLVSSRRTAGARNLELGIRAGGARGSVSGDDFVLPTSRLTERAVELVGRVPKPKGFEQRLQLQLDQAAWLMRANEFIVLTIASGLLGALVSGGLSGSLLLGLPVGLIAGTIPTMVLRMRIGRRRDAFVEQLPGTLSLLAGSLRAGYGLLQAIDTVVKEADEPTAQEFARVLTEARLGLPVDEALEGMAQRLDSEDFHWVVLAIGIQREVGGNLAELLTTVAETMRERATLRRQIRVLSAEGRMSAWVISLMPIVVVVALTILNPGYLAELFIRIEGLVMLGVGTVMLLIGALLLRKIVDIEV